MGQTTRPQERHDSPPDLLTEQWASDCCYLAINHLIQAFQDFIFSWVASTPSCEYGDGRFWPLSAPLAVCHRFGSDASKRWWSAAWMHQYRLRSIRVSAGLYRRSDLDGDGPFSSPLGVRFNFGALFLSPYSSLVHSQQKQKHFSTVINPFH